MPQDSKSNKAWMKLINKYGILDVIRTNGHYIIEAQKIKEFREPRLMAKWDCSESLPTVFKEHNINILPIDRKSYILSDFKLYQALSISSKINSIPYSLPRYLQTLMLNDINSEAIALNVMLLTGILDDFVGIEGNVRTFDGRMSTGKFNFRVDTFSGKSLEVDVNNAQCEIDGGFENMDSVVIIEMKTVLNEDFNVRQLYYPYRLWSEKVTKPIRLIFAVYQNCIYRLFEYKFEVKDNYSSCVLVSRKNYSLQSNTITIKDLQYARAETEIKNDDIQSKTDIPFIQADSFDKVLSLLYRLKTGSMTSKQIAEFMHFEERQAGYYSNAGRYLGLFERINGATCLTSLGNTICNMPPVQQNLALVKLILEHRIFAEFFDKIWMTGEIAGKNEVARRMIELDICSENVANRRAGSVCSWLRWIFELVQD